MKILFVSFVAGAILILTNISEYHVTDGQYFANSSRYFKKITFDHVNHGLWNASHCLEDLLNCWELTKADILCAYDKYKTTICGFWRDTCSETDGRLSAHITLFERYCKSYDEQMST